MSSDTSKFVDFLPNGRPANGHRHYLIKTEYAPVRTHFYLTAKNQLGVLTKLMDFYSVIPASFYLHRCIQMGWSVKQEIVDVTGRRDLDGAPVTGYPATGLHHRAEVGPRPLPLHIYACEDEDHTEGVLANELLWIEAEEVGDKSCWLCVDCYLESIAWEESRFRSGLGKEPKRWEDHETLEKYLDRMKLVPDIRGQK